MSEIHHFDIKIHRIHDKFNTRFTIKNFTYYASIQQIRKRRNSNGKSLYFTIHITKSIDDLKNENLINALNDRGYLFKDSAFGVVMSLDNFDQLKSPINFLEDNERGYRQ